MIDYRIGALLKRELLQWFASSSLPDGKIIAGRPDVAIATAKNTRGENQDRSIYARFIGDRADRCFSLFAVLDGIGGMIDGGRCAEIAIASIVSSLVSLSGTAQRISLIEALMNANQEVWREYNGRGGATFAGIFFEKGQVRSINIGDSHVYMYDELRGLIRESSDDRLGEQFSKIKGLEMFTLDPSLAGRLGQYLGMSGEPRPNIRVIERTRLRSPKSYFLISTDGAHASGDNFISSTFKSLSEPLRIAEDLIKRSSDNDEADNATIICGRASQIEVFKNEGVSGYEQLKVWSVHGVFNFFIPSGFVGLLSSPRTMRARETKKPKGKQMASAKGSIFGTSPKKTEAKEPNKSDVTIQQLPFKPISDDESPK